MENFTTVIRDVGHPIDFTRCQWQSFKYLQFEKNIHIYTLTVSIVNRTTETILIEGYNYAYITYMYIQYLFVYLHV